MNLGSNFPKLRIAEDTRQNTNISTAVEEALCESLPGPAGEHTSLNLFSGVVIPVIYVIPELPYTQGVSSHFS